MLSFHCAPSILSVYGGCAAENGNHFSIFSFVFLCYLLLTHDSAYLGLKIVCLKQNRRRVARPDLCRAWCRRGGFIFVFFCLFVVCFSCGMHTVRQRRRQLLHAVTSHTQTHATPRGRTRRFGRKHKQ